MLSFRQTCWVQALDVFCKVKDDLTSLHHSEVNAELALVIEQRRHCCSALCCMKSRKKGKPWFIFLHYRKHKTSKTKINPLLNRRKMLRTVLGLVLGRRITTCQSRWLKHGEWTLLVSLKTFFFKNIDSSAHLLTTVCFRRRPLQSSSTRVTGAGRKQTSGCTWKHHHHTWHALPTQPQVLKMLLITS